MLMTFLRRKINEEVEASFAMAAAQIMGIQSTRLTR
jgi:hypothetical protein